MSAVITLLACLAVVWYMGLGALWVAVVLIIIEVAFSFDNAVVNARVLRQLSPLWQRLFLTVGVVVAIFGMRLVFPILIVTLSAQLPWHRVIDISLHHPALYAEALEKAQPLVASFGGGFLLMLALTFFVEENKGPKWQRRLETAAMAQKNWLVPIIGVAAVLVISAVPANHHQAETLRAGLVGVGGFILIKYALAGVGRFAPRRSGPLVGWSALISFLYLEVVDASFSFDGVVGAFAITDNILLVMIGLGVGALWVRSLTVYLVRRNVFEELRYIEQGAHYAVFILSMVLLGSIFVHVPDALTGGASLLVIGGSLVASRRAMQGDGRT